MEAKKSQCIIKKTSHRFGLHSQAQVQRELCGLLPGILNTKPLSRCIDHPGEEAVPNELQMSINAQGTLGDLAPLMFSTDLWDERIVYAFLERKQKLEREGERTIPEEGESDPSAIAA